MYAIFYSKHVGDSNYSIKVQDTYTYKYVEDFNVDIDSLEKTLKMLRHKYKNSYITEIRY